MNKIFSCFAAPLTNESDIAAPSTATAVLQPALDLAPVHQEITPAAPPHKRKPLPTEMGFFPDAQPYNPRARVKPGASKAPRIMPMLLVSQSGERYLRGRRMAAGAFGKVYVAVRESDGQAFAAKVFRRADRKALSIKLNGSDRQKVRKTGISSERDIASEQDIALAVGAYMAPTDSGFGMGRHFLVLPLMGADLDELSRGVGKMADSLRVDARQAQALSLLAWGSEELAQLHTRKFIHRDVKPGNFLVAADGTVRLSDYGLAKHCVEGYTFYPGIVGTIDYMAPEFLQVEMARAQTDIYSLGLSAAAVAGGVHPHDVVRALTPKGGRDFADEIFLQWKASLPAPNAPPVSLEQRMLACPKATQAQLEALDGWFKDVSAALGQQHAYLVLTEMLAKNANARPTAVSLSKTFEAHRHPLSEARTSMQAQLKQLAQYATTQSEIAKLSSSWDTLRSWGLT